MLCDRKIKLNVLSILSCAIFMKSGNSSSLFWVNNEFLLSDKHDRANLDIVVNGAIR